MAVIKSDLSDTEKYASAGLFCLAYFESQRNKILQSENQLNTGHSDENSWFEEEFPLCDHVLRFLKINEVKRGTLKRVACAEDTSIHIQTFLNILSNEERMDPPALVEAESDLELAVNTFLAKEIELHTNSKSNSSSSSNSVSVSTSGSSSGSGSGSNSNSNSNSGSNLKSNSGSNSNSVSTSGSNMNIPLFHPPTFINNTNEKKNESIESNDANIINNPLLNDYENENESESENDNVYNDHENEHSEFKSELSPRLKVAIVWDLLSACVSDFNDKEKKETKKKETARKNGYDSRYRTTMRLLSSWIQMSWLKVTAIESMVALSFYEAQKQLEMAEKAKKSESLENTSGTSMQKWKRNAMIGASAIGVGSLLAVTGGLAAPALIAGFSALGPTVGTIIPFGSAIIASSAAIASSAIGSAAVIGAFGAAGAGLGGYKMAKRVAEVNEFYFLPISESGGIKENTEDEKRDKDNGKGKEKEKSDWSLKSFFSTNSNAKNVNSELKGVDRPRMAVEILISGFVKSNKDFILPWGRSKIDLESFALIYESEILIPLSTAIQDWLKSELTSQVIKRGAMLTVLNALVTAMAFPLAFISATNLIDSKWALAIDRSDKAGKLLADVLLNHVHGDRPLTLIGYSMGARVIWSCLNMLVSKNHQGGIIERVVLLGAPVPATNPNWQSVRKIVSGRFVNGFSTSDWTLGLMYRASFLISGTAGIQPVQCDGIENLDITNLVKGHDSYLNDLQNILNFVQIDSYFPTKPIVEVEDDPGANVQ